MTATTNEEIPRLPFHRDNVLQHPPQAKEMSQQGPVTRVRTVTGSTAWMVTRYELIKTLLSDERLGRDFPTPTGHCRDREVEKAEDVRRRKLLSPAFTARRIRLLEESVQSLADGLLDEMAQQALPVDMHSLFTYPLITGVMSELLGVPSAAQDDFRVWARQFGEMNNRELAEGGYVQLHEYIQTIVEIKRSQPKDDLISDLTSLSEEWHLTGSAIARYASLLIIASGTTATYIDLGTVFLLANPTQKELLIRNDALLPSVVEEVLRVVLVGSLGGLPRYAYEDLDIAGTRIRAGEQVILASGTCGNYDPSAFTEPECMDVTRSPNPHLTFGHGPGHCLGAALARMELQIVFRSLFLRFPGLRLAKPVEQLEIDPGQLTGGLEQLLVEW